MYYNTVTRYLLNLYNAYKTIYGIMVDGTQYISGKEQESIVIRFIDYDLPIELYFRLYEIKYTTGRAIAEI